MYKYGARMLTRDDKPPRQLHNTRKAAEQHATAVKGSAEKTGIHEIEVVRLGPNGVEVLQTLD